MRVVNALVLIIFIISLASIVVTLYFPRLLIFILGNAVAQLVEVTRREFAGSNPDGVIGIFHSLNPSGRIMALRSTQPITEVSTTGIFCG